MKNGWGDYFKGPLDVRETWYVRSRAGTFYDTLVTPSGTQIMPLAAVRLDTPGPADPRATHIVMYCYQNNPDLIGYGLWEAAQGDS